jgi:hypothetical protein
MLLPMDHSHASRVAETFIKIVKGAKEAEARAEWLDSAADAVLYALAERAEEYNNAHPDSIITFKDMIDACTVVSRIIEQASK